MFTGNLEFTKSVLKKEMYMLFSKSGQVGQSIYTFIGLYIPPKLH